MKRLLLIALVTVGIAWLGYSTYELWINKDNTANPQFVFCEKDLSILVINNLEETRSSGYFEIVSANPLAAQLIETSIALDEEFKIFISGNRPIIIFEKESRWTNDDIQIIKDIIKVGELNFHNKGIHLMVSQEVEVCKGQQLSNHFFLDADKKASANYWVFKNDNWARTDVYNLSKGFFEYQSSGSNVRYGNSIKDVELFSSVIPASSTSYTFKERFYAQEHDSIFNIGIMNQWVDKGFVEIVYQNTPVIISDYRSQQLPSLILIERSENEEDVEVLEDMHAFSGFQLTEDFPYVKEGVIYCFDIEDKTFFVESEEIARKIQVDYQLGNTLALSHEKQEQFFSGLPSKVNMRSISQESKSSLTWKDKLLFEVSTKPPSHQFVEVNKETWSFSPKFQSKNIVPIYDHLRNGTSLFIYSESGEYQLVSPNGRMIWEGSVDAPIEGTIKIIDLFGNQKHQFLFRTAKKVYLIDLNGSIFGNYPYQSDNLLTTGISEFEWNGTKRFLVGNEKGELIMLKNDGQELNIIQVGKESIISTPYALNLKGNLVAWALNSNYNQMIGYLERPIKPKMNEKIEGQHSVKYQGKILTYFEKEGQIYRQQFDSKTGNTEQSKLVDNGKLHSVNSDHLIVLDQNNVKVFSHELNINYTLRLPFNEIESVSYFPDIQYCVLLDYLQNKIYVYDKNGEKLSEFPKEGRNKAIAQWNENDKKLYVYTVIGQSIVCYKTKI